MSILKYHCVHCNYTMGSIYFNKQSLSMISGCTFSKIMWNRLYVCIKTNLHLDNTTHTFFGNHIFFIWEPRPNVQRNIFLFIPMMIQWCGYNKVYFFVFNRFYSASMEYIRHDITYNTWILLLLSSRKGRAMHAPLHFFILLLLLLL